MDETEDRGHRLAVVDLVDINAFGAREFTIVDDEFAVSDDILTRGACALLR